MLQTKQRYGQGNLISVEVLLKLAIHLAYGWQIKLITAMQMVLLKGHPSIFIYFCCVSQELVIIICCFILLNVLASLLVQKKKKNNGFSGSRTLHAAQKHGFCCEI